MWKVYVEFNNSDVIETLIISMPSTIERQADAWKKTRDFLETKFECYFRIHHISSFVPDFVID